MRVEVISIIKNMKQILKLGKLPIAKLRQLNEENHGAYTGKELTKYELIYQIVFLRDSPTEQSIPDPSVVAPEGRFVTEGYNPDDKPDIELVTNQNTL